MMTEELYNELKSDFEAKGETMSKEYCYISQSRTKHLNITYLEALEKVYKNQTGFIVHMDELGYIDED